MTDQSLGLRAGRPRLMDRLCAEALGTAALLIAVVGSGIMAERLADGNVALALLANALATAMALFVLIMAAAPVSGAHFNPAVTLVMVMLGRVTGRDGAAYVLAQIAGGVAGVALANLMFELPALHISQNLRWGEHLWLAEAVATAGLILTILAVERQAQAMVAACVALYIGGAYWFTASTAFANPAVTLARMFSDSFAGIAPAAVLPFIATQLGTAALLAGWHRRRARP